MKKLLIILIAFTIQVSTVSAQDILDLGKFKVVERPKRDIPEGDWFLKDYEQDGVYGISLYKAQKELLKGKKGEPVIVAFLDSGFEIDHPYIKPHLWVNKGEIPGNGIDDDNNGYIDDINGWNFFSTRDGKPVNTGLSEAQREYYRLKKLYEGGMKLDDVDPNEFAIYKELKIRYDRLEAEARKKSERARHTLAEVSKIKESKEYQQELKKKNSVLVKNTLRKESIAFRELSAGEDFPLAAERSRILLGDNPEIWEEKGYGSGVITATKHGTGVAGLTGGVPTENPHIQGVCQNAQLMLIRVLAGGDEHDKEIGNGIRYAVDNGAKIISISLAKNVASKAGQKFIEECVQYAVDHDVLVIKASGNNGQNMDIKPLYPNYTRFGKIGAGTINVANSSATLVDISSSNYGRRTVDICAPGSDLMCSVPGGKFDYMSGTSMATPVCSGVAALIRSYYPQLTAAEVKMILMQSAFLPDPTIKTSLGRVEKAVPFGELTVSGGIVNAYNALKMAEEYTSKKKK